VDELGVSDDTGPIGEKFRWNAICLQAPRWQRVGCPRVMHNRANSVSALEFRDLGEGGRGMVMSNASYRGRSDMFDPFESLIGSRANSGEDQASSEWKVGIRTWAPPCFIRVLDTDTDCDKMRFFMRLRCFLWSFLVGPIACQITGRGCQSGSITGSQARKRMRNDELRAVGAWGGLARRLHPDFMFGRICRSGIE
jgi:hypothetical protein